MKVFFKFLGVVFIILSVFALIIGVIIGGFYAVINSDLELLIVILLIVGLAVWGVNWYYSKYCKTDVERARDQERYLWEQELIRKRREEVDNDDEDRLVERHFERQGIQYRTKLNDDIKNYLTSSDEHQTDRIERLRAEGKISDADYKEIHKRF